MKKRNKMPVCLSAKTPRRRLIQEATVAFAEHGAEAAAKLLGSPERQRLLLPKVFARAKYLERCAKRLAQ